MTPQMEAKARRLAARGCVHQLKDARVFVVEGDHGVYPVIVDPSGFRFCACRSTTECSHLAAAAELLNESPKEATAAAVNGSRRMTQADGPRHESRP